MIATSEGADNVNDFELHLAMNCGGKPGTENVLEHWHNPTVLDGLLSTDTVPLALRVPASKYSQANESVYVQPSLYHKMVDAMASTVGRIHGYGALMTGILNADEERTLEQLVRRKLGHRWDGGDRPRALPLIQAIRITVFVMSRPKALSRREIAKIAGVTHPTLNKMISELQPILQSIADEGAAIAAQKIAA